MLLLAVRLHKGGEHAYNFTSNKRGHEHEHKYTWKRG